MLTVPKISRLPSVQGTPSCDCHTTALRLVLYDVHFVSSCCRRLLEREHPTNCPRRHAVLTMKPSVFQKRMRLHILWKARYSTDASVSNPPAQRQRRPSRCRIILLTSWQHTSSICSESRQKDLFHDPLVRLALHGASSHC